MTLGFLLIAIAAATVYCIIGAATQSLWGQLVEKITRRGDTWTD